MTVWPESVLKALESFITFILTKSKTKERQITSTAMLALAAFHLAQEM